MKWLSRLLGRDTSGVTPVLPIVLPELTPSSAPPPASPPPPPDAYEERQRQLARHATTPKDLSLFMRDWSGYVRQIAVERSVELRCWQVLPELAERLNDWVPQIRDVAGNGLMSLITPETVTHLLPVLPAVGQLRHKSRVDHTKWATAFGRAMLAADTAAVIDGVSACAAAVRRACFELLVHEEVADTRLLIERVLRGRSDNVLASRAVELCALLPAAQRDELYTLALRSPYATVRSEALRALLAGPHSAEKSRMACTALLDPKTHARAVAADYLLPQGFNRAEFYRDVLNRPESTGAHRRVAVVALGALGTPDDAVLLRQLASTASDSLERRAALLALLRIAPADKDDIALTALQDADSHIRRIALAATVRFGAFIPFDQVAYVLEQADDPDLLLRFARLHWPVAAAFNNAFEHAPASRLMRGLLAWGTSPVGARACGRPGQVKGSLPVEADAVVVSLIGAGR